MTLAKRGKVMVAVEEDLAPVRMALARAGFTVVSLAGNAWNEAQAIVVNGLDDRFLGMEDPRTAAPVIDAAGMTPEEVVASVQERALRA
ncbi:conserved protein of unknown function [Candidatus Hydrogenisulfobacillus filiaventi]|uniref:YkuS family protein n=1 Tax=Candidatus Hydrogenisulfobacillus filiaventi TaxID=2707344 RepID=A0A6F8ZE78_9FIRM|nr:YkuS family protein [Bacillota bacterium]CAB1127943.1 conserved protein of unknown function [Candidatus Hydrogenisulfobacillus filiaventi]